MILRF
jgi:hypothetical protein